jgi:2TM domain-containing protein
MPGPEPTKGSTGHRVAAAAWCQGTDLDADPHSRVGAVIPGRADREVTAMTQMEHTEQDLRERAVKRLKKRRDFAAHLIVYVMVNTFIVVIWAVTSDGFFWPIFPMAGWGIGVVMNGWDVYRGDEFTEQQIAEEMARLQKSG